MPGSHPPRGIALPEPVLRFAQQGAGLFVFSGPHHGASAAAQALAAHVGAATGRRAEHLVPGGLRTVSTGPGLLVDDRARMNVDRLLTLVAKAEAGRLVIATMDYEGRHPATHLLDVIRLAEDIDCTLLFQGAFYAAATVQPDGTVQESGVQLGNSRLGDADVPHT